MQMQIVRQNINLVDGRRLAYAFFGNSLSATAKNIIYHHGWPSSAAEGAIWSEAAAAHGICLIAVDRPGIGGSTYNPKGTFASYADDVSELLHQLNLQQAVHVGTSGGGPYACACAANNPTTTAGLGLVASMTHCSGSGSKQLLHGMHWFDRFGYNMIANAPQLVAAGLAVAAPLMAAAPAVARLLQGSSSNSSSSSAAAAAAPAGHQQEAKYSKHPQAQQQGLMGMFTGAASRAAQQLLGAFMHPADRQLLQQQPAAFSQLLPSMLADSVAQGSRGLFHEMRLTTQPWAIDLSQITAPALVIQGYADVNVTVPQAKWLAGQLKNVKLQLFPGETHFSLVARHAHGILGMIKAECM